MEQTLNCEIPCLDRLKKTETDRLESLACDCFEVLRERGEMKPFLDTDDLGVINATAFILETADDSDLEDVYYLIEDELLARNVFTEDDDDA
ncbi:MAG: hypothetical protein RSE43_08490 [Oscillospiraceae bacterium]